MARKTDPGDLAVVAATAADKPVFANLIQLYLYDMAPYFGSTLDASGRYEHEILDEAWAHPYLIRLGGEIAGFALITRHCTIRERSPCWYVAEFCVLRPYRRAGLGRRALSLLFDRHPGEWEITWFDGNRPAAGFWPAVIPKPGRETHRIAKHGLAWTSVAFTVAAG